MFGYIRTLALAAAATLALAGIINFIIDPANIFDETRAYERGIAKLLLEGWNVANIVNYDERLTQELYIEGLSEAPNITIFGSSRSMQLRSKVFPGHTFFNHGVSGATLEDHLAIYQIYRQHELAPKHVVIGADPWILNANNEQSRWRTLSGYLINISNDLSIQAPFQNSSALQTSSNRYLQLFSFAYIEESLKYLWAKARRGDQKYFATRESELVSNVELADGSLVYNAAVRNRPANEVRIRAIGNAKQGAIYSLGGFTQLDGRAMQALDAWIRLMVDDSVKVTIFLPPYHPASYSIMSSNPRYEAVSEAAAYFRQLAKDRGLNVIGDYDGAKAGCNENEFTDDMHPTDACVTRIFEQASIFMR